MRCGNCNKKCVPICCSYCSTDCCSSCIQLEVHGCTGLEQKCKDMMQKLQETLPQIIAKKHNVTY